MSNLSNTNDPTPQDLGAPTFVPGAGAFVKPKNRIPAQTIILLLVLGVSAGALYAMRQYGIKSGMSFEVSAAEVPSADNEKARTYERIMADLARIEKPLDSALIKFGESPFHGKVRPAGPDGPPVDNEEWARINRITELQAMLDRHKLRSVMNGTVPLARIDEDTLTVGDVLDDTFTVTLIEFPKVGFSVAEKGLETYPFELSMEDAKPKEIKKSPVKVGGSEPTAPAFRR